MKRHTTSISGNCVACGTYRATLHRDHITPKFKGGTDDPSNIQHLCANCHEDKSRVERTGSRPSAEVCERMRVAALKRAGKPEHRERVSLQMTALWKDPEYVASMRKSRSRNQHRVTPRGVQLIREMKAAGMTQQAIADYFGLRRETVSCIVRGKNFEWVCQG